MQAPGRAAPTPSAPSAQRVAATGLPQAPGRAARGRDRAAAGARARSAHATGAERVARAVDGSQRLRRPAHRRAAPSARSALGAQRRAPSAERVARGGDQARRRRRARSAHATGAERVARGGASWHAGAASTQASSWRLMPASATLTKKGSPALALAHYIRGYAATSYLLKAHFKRSLRSSSSVPLTADRARRMRGCRAGAALHAPGLLSTSQLSIPGTHWVAPHAGIA